MREIKFRAWDKLNKKLFFPQLLYDRNKFRYQMTQESEYSWESSKYSDCLDIMQYTGLKDKNGVEIYEGDIVSAPHDFGPGGFSERQFVVRWHNELGYQWNYWLMEKSEVIGNIYETPELLD